MARSRVRSERKIGRKAKKRNPWGRDTWYASDERSDFEDAKRSIDKEKNAWKAFFRVAETKRLTVEIQEISDFDHVTILTFVKNQWIARVFKRDLYASYRKNKDYNMAFEGYDGSYLHSCQFPSCLPPIKGDLSMLKKKNIWIYVWVYTPYNT